VLLAVLAFLSTLGDKTALGRRHIANFPETSERQKTHFREFAFAAFFIFAGLDGIGRDLNTMIDIPIAIEWLPRLLAIGCVVIYLNLSISTWNKRKS
jgi:hypothetical protein